MSKLPPPNPRMVQRVAEILANADRVLFVTGAGISAESGLATFRDSDGLWEKHDPMEIATPEAFARDPALVYRFYNARRNQLADVEPLPPHPLHLRLV